MIRRLTLACVGLALCAAGATQLFAAGPEAAAAGKGTDYVRTLQQDDGGFPDFGTGSSAGATLDASFAFASTGVDPLTVKTITGKSPADFLASQASTYSASPGGAAKLVLGVATLNLNATSFGGIDPLAVMEANYDPATGLYGTDLFAQAYFILAEARLHRPVPAAAISFAGAAQHGDGGWADSGAFEETNTTALMTRALIAGGVPASDQHVIDGLAYLKASQQADGGFPFVAPGDSDADSTAYGIQAIVAARQSVGAGGPWDEGAGKTPLSALLAFQNPTTGAFQFSGTDNAFATYQAIPGLMLSAFERPASEQAATLTAIANASTATPTRTASATPSTTAIVTLRTSTPKPSATATTATAAATSTPVRVVLGDTAAPTRVSSVLPSTRLPNTGNGAAKGGDAAAWLLILSGALSVIGAAALRRGAR